MRPAGWSSARTRSSRSSSTRCLARCPTTGSGKGSISRYSIGSDGKLTLLGNTDTTPAGFPGDEALSSDGKYLYVLTPFVMGKNQSHLDAYSVSGGNLTHIQATPSNLAVGQSGVGVH